MACRRARLWMAGTALAAFPALAMAQAGAEPGVNQLEEVVVTGTSIKGVAPVGAPVLSLSQEAIRETGLSSTTDIVETLPQFLSLGADEGRGGLVQNASANIAQGTAINLRGLGTESTLVLVGGRRVAVNGFQGNYVDISTIPAGALARLEVVPDGASAVYGSDAVAGVVNLILRRRFDGAETTGRYGHADGFSQYQFSQTLGKTWDRGDAFLAYEHYERGNLLGLARKEFASDLRRIGGPDRRQNFCSPGTIVRAGMTFAIPAGQNGRGLTPAQLTAGTQSLCELNETKDYLPKQNRDSVVGNVHYDLTDTLHVYYEGYYADRGFVYRGRTLTASAATAALAVPATHPFNPFGAPLTVNYNFGDEFLSITTGGETTFQNAVGASWKAFSDWTVDAVFSHSSNKLARRIDGSLRTINLAAALNDRNPATVLNPFGDGQVNNPATLASLRGVTNVDTRFIMRDYVLKANGSLFELPGGAVRLAVGFERYEQSFANTDANDTTFAVYQTRTQSYIKRDVDAVFGEVFVPIVSDANARPGIQRLEVNGAIRYDKYSDFGSTTNPKLGVSWEPVSDLTVRGSYGTSFRAPTLPDNDITSGGSVQLQNIVDPRSTAANGLTRGIVILGGRVGVGPEEADTWSIGADWKPAGIPGLSASISYYSIDYKNRIDTPGVPILLANEATYAGDLVIRNPTAAQVAALFASPFFGGVPEPAANIRLIVDTRKNNIGSTRQAGVDITARYAFETAFGDWTLGVDLNQITKAKRQLADGQTYIDVLDLINNPIRTRARLSANWSKDGWRSNVFVNYVGDYRSDQVNPVAKVGDWTTVDANLSYSTGEDGPWALRNLRFTATATNLFDRDPPKVINGVLGFDSQNASPIGRMVSFEVSKSW